MPYDTHPNEESLRTEYAATNDAYMHYDNFAWQVGAVLIAGAFVFWGFLVGQDKASPALLTVSSILVTVMMSIWLLYSDHNRQIYLCKIHRLHEIETMLGMEQHRRWGGSDPMYRTYGLNGHRLDALVYILVSLGSPLIGVFKVGLYPWLGLPALIVISCLIWTSVNGRSIKKHLRETIKNVASQETPN